VSEKSKTDEKRIGRSVLHAGFEVGILLKGVHAALEVVGGVLLWLVNPASLGRIVKFLTQNELAEDPRDLLANFIVRMSARYSISAQHFGVFYLLSHGGIKVVLVLLLWRKKEWAYPLAVATLVLFIIYQTIRWTTTHSVFLVVVTALDALMIWLTIVEYKRIRSERLLPAADAPTP
jgi:uncharacterized membrane protein